MLVEAAEKENVDLINATHILMSLTNEYSDAHFNHTHMNTEDTFVHNSVAPFLKQLFCGPNIRTYW
jgi:hypothetical protein